jgi:tetratricopeptide (TPR) repeat protein
MKRIQSIALLSFIVPLFVGASANAQMGYGGHCDTPRPSRAVPSHDNQFERAFRSASNTVDEAAELVAHFDSTQAQRSLRSAFDDLDIARSYARRGDRQRALSAVASAESHARNATYYAEALIEELERYRDTAHASLRRTESEIDHRHASSRVDSLLHDAEDHIEAGESLMRSYNYARARNEFAEAIEQVESARDQWVAERERSRHHAHGSSHGSSRRYSEGRVVSATYRGGRDTRSW